MTLTMFPAGQASDDARLVNDARRERQGAFACLYDATRGSFTACCWRGAPRADVEDLVQDVFLSA